MNTSNRSQAEEQHKQAAALFRTKEPSMLAKHYHLEKILPLGQLVYSESKENMNLGGTTQGSSSTSTLKQTTNKYRFWTMTQKISLKFDSCKLKILYSWQFHKLKIGRTTTFILGFDKDLKPKFLYLRRNFKAYSSKSFVS